MPRTTVPPFEKDLTNLLRHKAHRRNIEVRPDGLMHQNHHGYRGQHTHIYAYLSKTQMKLDDKA